MRCGYWIISFLESETELEARVREELKSVMISLVCLEACWANLIYAVLVSNWRNLDTDYETAVSLSSDTAYDSGLNAHYLTCLALNLVFNIFTCLITCVRSGSLNTTQLITYVSTCIGVKVVILANMEVVVTTHVELKVRLQTPLDVALRWDS